MPIIRTGKPRFGIIEGKVLTIGLQVSLTAWRNFSKRARYQRSLQIRAFVLPARARSSHLKPSVSASFFLQTEMKFQQKEEIVDNSHITPQHVKYETCCKDAVSLRNTCDASTGE